MISKLKSLNYKHLNDTLESFKSLKGVKRSDFYYLSTSLYIIKEQETLCIKNTNGFTIGRINPDNSIEICINSKDDTSRLEFSWCGLEGYLDSTVNSNYECLNLWLNADRTYSFKGAPDKYFGNQQKFKEIREVLLNELITRNKTHASITYEMTCLKRMSINRHRVGRKLRETIRELSRGVNVSYTYIIDISEWTPLERYSLLHEVNSAE